MSLYRAVSGFTIIQIWKIFEIISINFTFPKEVKFLKTTNLTRFREIVICISCLIKFITNFSFNSSHTVLICFLFLDSMLHGVFYSMILPRKEFLVIISFLANFSSFFSFYPQLFPATLIHLTKNFLTLKILLEFEFFPTSTVRP